MNHIADRTVDEVGRIVLPTQIREMLELTTGSKVSIFVKDGEVLLRKETPVCRLCGSEKIANNEQRICVDCINKIKNA